MKKRLLTIGTINYRHLLPDLIILTASLFLSLSLRLNSSPDFSPYFGVLLKLAPVFILLRVAVYFFCGAYDVIWRYISLRDSVTLMKASAISTLVIISATFLFGWDRIPRSVYLIDGVISTLGIIGIRIARRYVFETERSKKPTVVNRRVLIYGAGATGLSLLKQYTSGSWERGQVIGFIDDDPEKIKRMISGFKVWGPLEQLPALLAQYEIQEVVLAFRTASGEKIRKIVELTRETNTQIRLLSETSGSRNAVKPLDSTRKIELRDLLARPQRNVDLSKISELVRGKRVLVTGAGGSIGSELCRQIFSHEPSQLLLLDNAELHLYQIDQELRSPTDARGPVVPLLVDIRDKEALERVFQKYAPQIVFHAAAYKHVHLVECNPFSAILNNVEGTHSVVDLSLKASVEHLVLISTDKAVNPAGVMGATKRICEMIVSTAGRDYNRNFCSVRFGNVLGSSGSFVPLMQKQIEEGGPVTVTHPDMQRFLMLIPEAVSLVLNAATLGEAGDIMILRMGEPIHILELAKSLITLYGKTEKEIPIVYTGIRPGEKLVEELYLRGNEAKTEHPDVLVLPKGDAISDAWTYQKLSKELAELYRLARLGETEAVKDVERLVRVAALSVPTASSAPDSDFVDDDDFEAPPVLVPKSPRVTPTIEREV